MSRRDPGVHGGGWQGGFWYFCWIDLAAPLVSNNGRFRVEADPAVHRMGRIGLETLCLSFLRVAVAQGIVAADGGASWPVVGHGLRPDRPVCIPTGHTSVSNRASRKRRPYRSLTVMRPESDP